MGVNTKGVLKGKVQAEMILNFIKQKYDNNAAMDIETKNYGEVNGSEWIVNSGFISFKYGEKHRQMFYYLSNKESYDYENVDNGIHTQLSLGYNEDAINIMTEVVAEFGGWIDENDCDDIPFTPIEKNSDGTIKPVFYVTMEEVYEKFGGVVIIKK